MLEKLDLFPKTLSEFRVRTSSGGAASILVLVLGCLIIASNTSTLMAVRVKHDITVVPFVDSDASEQSLSINLDLWFPHVSCERMGLDARDESGAVVDGVESKMYRTRLVNLREAERQEHNFLAEHGSAAKHEDFIEVEDGFAWHDDDGKAGINAHQRKRAHAEGCRWHGYFVLPTKDGAFRFGPRRQVGAGLSLEDFLSMRPEAWNMSHKIEHLSFGNSVQRGATNQLQRQERHTQAKTGLWQYYLKLVRTELRRLDGKVISSYQFAVTEHFLELQPGVIGGAMPGVYFHFSTSPLQMVMTEESLSRLGLLTNICGVFGGLYTLLGVLDRAWFASQRRTMQPGIVS